MIAAVPPCGDGAAKAAILASAVPETMKLDVRQPGAGVDRVLCRDLTGDGLADMAVTVFSGGTAGVTSWAVFRRTGAGWRLAFAEGRAYKASLFAVGRDIVESTPIYLANDPNCCPTGGFAHRRFRFSGARLRLVRSWSDRSARPAGGVAGR